MRHMGRFFLKWGMSSSSPFSRTWLSDDSVVGRHITQFNAHEQRQANGLTSLDEDRSTSRGGRDEVLRPGKDVQIGVVTTQAGSIVSRWRVGVHRTRNKSRLNDSTAIERSLLSLPSERKIRMHLTLCCPPSYAISPSGTLRLSTRSGSSSHPDTLGLLNASTPASYLLHHPSCRTVLSALLSLSRRQGRCELKGQPNAVYASRKVDSQPLSCKL
ncbi:hypothetical protein EDD15DRAFT_1186821 [Pisolithus albus]|nr:hypothetical protein EDD15DRAFT_1186821 [Pisolithus albus]